MRLQTSCAHCGSAQRASLVDRIIGNSTLTRAQLAKLDIPTLEAFDEAFAKGAAHKTADYSGRAVAVAPYANTAEDKKLTAAFTRNGDMVAVFQAKQKAAPPSLNQRRPYWPVQPVAPSLQSDAELVAAVRPKSLVEVFAANASRGAR
jgi:hypothetical protein